MKNTYVLVCVHERDIKVNYHRSYGSAYMQMVKELDRTLDGERDKFAIDNDYYLSDFSAWSNTYDNRDWLIEKINSDSGNPAISGLTEVEVTLLQFAFETGDTSCPWYQVFAIAQSDKDIDYAAIEDSLSSYMEQKGSEDKEFETIVEDVLNVSGLLWSFIPAVIPESRAIHTFWI